MLTWPITQETGEASPRWSFRRLPDRGLDLGLALSTQVLTGIR